MDDATLIVSTAVVGMLVALVATLAHYVLAPRFAKRYAGAFDVHKILTNDVPHALDAMIEARAPKLMSDLEAAVGRAVGGAYASVVQQAMQTQKSAQMSELGQRSAEVRAQNKTQKAAVRAQVLSMIETKFPGASMIIPKLEEQFGIDIIEMAAQNPQAAMALVDKFTGMAGGGGGGAIGKGW